MTPGKRLKVSIIALFAFFAGLSSCCYGEACGFDSSCPYIIPPCYKVTFKDQKRCDWAPEAEIINGTRMLPYMFMDDDLCTYYHPSEEGEDHWTIMLGVIADGYTTLVATDSATFIFHCDSSSTNGVGDCNDGTDISSCCGPPEYPDLPCMSVYGVVSAHWEPVWDCSACEVCDYNIPTYVNPENYNDVNYLCSNPDCCPVGKFNPYNLTIYTDDPNVAFVVPDCNTSDPCIATVTSYPSTCAAGKSVTFTITPHQAVPPAEATVTCTVSFFTVFGDTVSRTETITVKPDQSGCCACSVGSSGGGDGGNGGDIGWSSPAGGGCGGEAGWSSPACGGGSGPPLPCSPDPIIGFI